MVDMAGVTGRVVFVRATVFLVVLGASGGIGLAAVGQESVAGAVALGIAGGLGLPGIMWLVGRLRGTWSADVCAIYLVVALLGSMAVQIGGEAAVSALVLVARGERVEVTVFMTHTSPKSSTYALYPVDHDLPRLRSELSTYRRYVDGERITVLTDPARFVRSQLPENSGAAGPTIFAALGLLVLGLIILAGGFPLRGVARQDPR
jgi:hypothetical protein